MKKCIRIGSRESKLAVTQAEIVKETIRKNCPDLEVEIITMKTTGDIILDKSLELIGGKGLFVKELDIALREERIDISVHSLKDMPMEADDEFPVFAYTKREDPRDVLIYKPGKSEIPMNGVIATSSRRRTIQMKKLYPECEFIGMRGNVQTRLRKLSEQPIDGTVLAAAGLNRLHLESVIGRIFTVDEVVPAAGQGILAVQGSKAMERLLSECLNVPESEAAALAERQFVNELDGGCTSPIAAHAKVAGQDILLTGLYYREADDTYYVERRAGESKDAKKLGAQLAKEMRRNYEQSSE
ncbi:MAG: hydroxymethylbilane synthase [Lachnospiraceae bacterium]